MRRTQMYLTDEQRKRLAQRAKDAGTSEASVIREILDDALGIDHAEERLARARKAFGSCKDYPDWPEWLSSVRGKGADERLKELGL
jgi:hypothetical protein